MSASYRPAMTRREMSGCVFRRQIFYICPSVAAQNATGSVANRSLVPTRQPQRIGPLASLGECRSPLLENETTVGTWPPWRPFEPLAVDRGAIRTRQYIAVT